MSEYSCVITVNAPADEVFGLICDRESLGAILPMTQGEGDMRCDEDSRRLEWTSRGEEPYRGWLQIAGDEKTCQLSVRLRFPAHPKPQPETQEKLKEMMVTLKRAAEGSAVPGGGRAYPA